MFEKKKIETENIPDGQYCPHIGQVCIKTKCMHWKGVLAMEQEERTEKWIFDCIFNLMRPLSLETSKQTYFVNANIQALRNETAAANRNMMKLQLLLNNAKGLLDDLKDEGLKRALIEAEGITNAIEVKP